MKFLLAFALVAVASAANIKPVALPRAAIPEVAEPIYKVQVVESAPVGDAVKIVESPEEVSPSVKVVESAPVSDAVKFVDSPQEVVETVRVASPVFESVEGVKLAIPTFEDVEAVKVAMPTFEAVDRVIVVDVAQNIEADRFVDAPVDAVRVVDAPIEQVRFVDSPAEAQTLEMVRVAPLVIETLPGKVFADPLLR